MTKTQIDTQIDKTPETIVSEAIGAAIDELDLGWFIKLSSFHDSYRSVLRLKIHGELPDWFSSLHFHQRRVAEHAARSLGVWPWPDTPATMCVKPREMPESYPAKIRRIGQGGR